MLSSSNDLSQMASQIAADNPSRKSSLKWQTWLIPFHFKRRGSTHDVSPQSTLKGLDQRNQAKIPLTFYHNLIC